MAIRARAYSSFEDHQSYKWPFLISLAGHLILFGLIVVRLDFQSTPSYQPSVINVRMVELSDKPAASGGHTTKSAEKAPVVEKVKPAETKAPQPKAAVGTKPEVSLAPHKARTKTALKYKTFKSKEILKRAIEQLERKVETAPPRPLEDTIKRLKEEVAKTEKSSTGGSGEPEATGPAKGGAFAVGSRQEIELIDLYRQEVAFQVQKNWAFAEQLGGGGKKLMASIIFKVMPDGKITDIFFTDRSGNPYLDDSAYKAIVKSSPVKPHPAALQRPYVEMGLRFTPEGVN